MRRTAFTSSHLPNVNCASFDKPVFLRSTWANGTQKLEANPCAHWNCRTLSALKI